VRLKVGVPMAPTYDAENRIDIFSGPSFKFERQGDQLHVHFLRQAVRINRFCGLLLPFLRALHRGD